MLEHEPVSREAARVAAVVVDYDAGDALRRCVDSLHDAGVIDVVVVENGSSKGAPALLASEPPPRIVVAARNGGYGAGANLGAAETDRELLLVCNPDLVVDRAMVDVLVASLDAHPGAAVAGPMLLEPDGTVYPSGRAFPALVDSLGHGFVGLLWRGNPWTRRYRLLGDDQLRARDADWVSGACFLVRAEAFWAVGGFDEAYFMYVEDVDLCWRLHRAGWAVRYEPAAQVVHEQGRSTSRRPYRMLVAHHRSMLRFANRSATGRQRLLLPVVALGLVLRLALASLEHVVAGRRGQSGPRAGRE